ncbi:MAG: biopolymer transporter ExbD [Planctomycetota bacterium]|nr:MAG: biopolymer transporter ExbD [Planctomycetota bacterium]
MQLRPSSERFRRVSTGLRVTAMIDVIFLLLIFFMATTSLTPPESRLSPALAAERREAGASDLTPQIVRVRMQDGSPVFQFGARILRDKRSLTALLRTLPKEQGVFVKVEDDAPVEAAAAALQACRDAGFARVTYVPQSR